MASREKKIINVETEIKGSEKPFQWGDELGSPREKSESEVDNHSYTSVAELLEDKEKIEKKRLEEYFQKLSNVEISK